MGNHNNKVPITTTKPENKPEPMSLKKFTKVGVIGRGGFGKVIFLSYRFGESKAKKIKNHSP